MRRPFSVQVFLYRGEGDHEFLLFKRRARPDLDLPGFWQGVSDALLDDETFAAAAVREVAEEAGIAISMPIATGFRVSYPIRPEWRPHYGPKLSTDQVRRPPALHSQMRVRQGFAKTRFSQLALNQRIPKPLHVEEQIYYAQIASDATVSLSSEHEEFAWVDKRSAFAKLTFGQNREALESVINVLK